MQPSNTSRHTALPGAIGLTMLRTFRTGIIRPLDELGRVVLAMEYRRVGNLQPKDALMQSLVVDSESGRVVGILVEPVNWLFDPDAAPKLTDMLNEVQITVTGSDLDMNSGSAHDGVHYLRVLLSPCGHKLVIPEGTELKICERCGKSIGSIKVLARESG